MKSFTRNVLVEVDVQHDFIDGNLAVSGGEEIVEPLNDVARAVRASSGQVVATRDWHPAATPHFDTWPVHCVADTNGAAFHPDLQLEAEDVILSKGMGQTDGYSGWEGISADGQTLETLLEVGSPAEKVRVFIGGLATDYCVNATALDIAQHYGSDERYSLFLLRDAIRAVGLAPNDEQRALDAMKAAKFFAISSAEAITMIERDLS